LELRQYFYLIRKWAWLIALCTLLAGTAAYVTSSLMTPVYRASVTLRISTPDSQGTSDYTALLASQRLAQTYAQLLKEAPVLKAVISNLGLAMTPRDLAALVTVEAVRDTDLIRVAVEHTSPARAQAIADEIPQVFLVQDQALQAMRYAALKASLAAKMEEQEAEIGRLQQEIASRKATGAGADDTELLVLGSDLEQARSNFATLLKSFSDVELAEAQSGTSVAVAAPAEVPDQPVRPRKLLNTVLAAVAGAILAVAGAFLMEYLDDTVKTPGDVQAALGLVTLGAIWRSRDGAESGVLGGEEGTRTHHGEPFRVLRTNVQFSQVDRPLRSLMMTSPGPVEGKSTVVANLAAVMAQAGQRVILVDADLRRPRQHKIFGLENQEGLTSALLAEDPTPGVWLQDTQVDNLRLVTSGPLPPNPSELLGSQRMGRLIELLQGEADLVLFDSPPTLATADPAVLARQVDAVLLLVKSGGTRRPAAKQALQTLQQVGARVLGVVLNKVSASPRGYYYYYYSHYGSEYGSDAKPRRGLAGLWGRVVARPKRAKGKRATDG
jgi:polysaccharide biosynthesis transport protein